MNQTQPTSAPTPDEVRWAAGMMNARRYGRPATDADLAAASDIMSRQRKAHGQRRKASEARLAEALGAQDARQGAVVERPATVADAPPAAPPAAPASPLTVARAAVAAGITEMVAQPADDEPAPALTPDPEGTPAAYPVPSAEEGFRQASTRLLEVTRIEEVRFRQARDQAAKLVAEYDARLLRLEQRSKAVADGLRALDREADGG